MRSREGGAVGVPVLFRALGPVGVEVDGVEVDLRPRERLILALLLSQSNHPVPPETLVDWAWGDSPPASARTAIRVHIDRIRGRLREHHVTRLVTAGAGYRLVVEPGELDIDTIASSRARARDLRSTDLQGAAELLNDAMGLCRGVPFAGIEDIEPIDTLRRHLTVELEGLALDFGDCELALGRHDELLPLVVERANAYPYSERLALQEAVARYRAGDPSGAAASLRTFVTRLRDELGMDPSAPLRQMQRDILAHAAALAAPTHVPRALPAGSVPSDPPGGLVGDLQALLQSRPSTDRPRLVAVTGPRGFGKTHLLKQLAVLDPSWRLLRAQPGVSAVADLEAEPGLVTRQRTQEATPGGGDLQRARAEGLGLAMRQQGVAVLLVDDPQNLSTDDVAVLTAVLSSETAHLTIVTASISLTPEDNPLTRSAPVLGSALHLQLASLTEEESRAVLLRLLPLGLVADADLIADVVRRSEGHPLLLTAMARQLSAGSTVDEVPRTVQEYVHRLMDSLTPHQVELVRAAVVDPSPTVEPHDLSLLLGLSMDEVERDLDLLSAVGIVTDSVDGVSFRHSLVRDAIRGSLPGHRISATHESWARLLLHELADGDDRHRTERLAHHLRHSRSREARELAAPWTAREADLRLGRGELQRAAELYRTAALLAAEARGTDLLGLGWELDAAAAMARLGNLRDSQALACSVAERSHRVDAQGVDAVFARAAVLSVGPWFPFGRERDEAARLTAEALESVPAGNPMRTTLVEAFIRCHSASEDVADGDRLESLEWEMADVASTADTAQVRATAIRALVGLSWRRIGSPDERHALTTRLVREAARSGDPALTLEAHRLLARNAIEAGKPLELFRSLRDYYRLATRSGSSLHAWWAATLCQTRATMIGSAPEQEAAARLMAKHANSVDPDLVWIAHVERLFAESLRGEATGLADALGHLPDNELLLEPIMRLGLLAVARMQGQPVDLVHAHDTWVETRNTARHIPGCALATVALGSDHDTRVRGFAAELRQALEPCTGGFVTLNGAGVFGPIDSFLARLYAILGDESARDRGLQRARLLQSTLADRPQPAIIEGES